MILPHDHSDPLLIPEPFCRRCHPELNRTPDQSRRLAEAERAKQTLEWAKRDKEQALATTQRKLEAAQRRNPHPTSVDGKIMASLVLKVARLTDELLLY